METTETTEAAAVPDGATATEPAIVRVTREPLIEAVRAIALAKTAAARGAPERSEKVKKIETILSESKIPENLESITELLSVIVGEPIALTKAPSGAVIVSIDLHDWGYENGGAFLLVTPKVGTLLGGSYGGEFPRADTHRWRYATDEEIEGFFNEWEPNRTHLLEVVGYVSK